MINNIIEIVSNISYFEERVVSITIFLIILFVFTILIRKANNYKKIKKYLIAYIICLSIMGFLFIPAPAHDLYRLFVDMHKFDNLSWGEFLSSLFSSIRYTRNFLYFLVVNLNHDGFLAMFAALIYYSNVFYIIYDYSKDNNIESKAVSKTLFLYMIAGQFGDVVAGIRSFCAFSICALCIYREMYKGKSVINDLVLYFLAIGMHSVSIPIILIRAIFLIFQKEKVIYKKIVNIILFIIITLIGLKFGETIIQEAFAKGSSYINVGEAVSWLFWNKIGCWIMMLIIFVMLFNLKYNYKTNFNVKNYKLITLFFIVFELVFAFIEDNIFYRFSMLMFTLFLPYSLNYYNSIPSHKSKYHLYINEVLIYLLEFSLIIVEFSRGTLCGIKFFEII